MKKEIYNYLKSKGIKNLGKGFEYLIRAIELGIQKKDDNIGIVEIYSKIAEEENKKYTQIERSIRYIVTKSNADMRNGEFIRQAVSEISLFDYEDEILNHDCVELLTKISNDIKKLSELMQNLNSIETKINYICDKFGG